MSLGFRATIAAALGIVLVGAMAQIAVAQEDVSQKTIPSLELEQADVREALRALYKNVNVSYSIAPDVQGVVTVSLKNVTFETALQHILRQVDATYRVEGGVHEIIKRTDTVAPISGLSEGPSNVKSTITRRIKIRSADPQFIAMMIGAKSGNQNYTIAPEMSTVSRGNSMGGSSNGLGGGRSGGGSSGSGGFGSGSLGSSGGIGGGTLGGSGSSGFGNSR